eukprot:scpid3211/ scgid30481/ 
MACVKSAALLLCWLVFASLGVLPECAVSSRLEEGKGDPASQQHARTMTKMRSESNWDDTGQHREQGGAGREGERQSVATMDGARFLAFEESACDLYSYDMMFGGRRANDMRQETGGLSTEVLIHTVEKTSTRPDIWLKQLTIVRPRPCVRGHCQGVDTKLERELSDDLFFEQDHVGHITQIYHEDNEKSNSLILKRGLLSVLQLNLTGVHQGGYTVQETGESGRYRANYTVHSMSLDVNGQANVQMTKLIDGRDFIDFAHPSWQYGTTTAKYKFDIGIQNGILDTVSYSYINQPVAPVKERQHQTSTSFSAELEIFGRGKLTRKGSCEPRRHRRAQPDYGFVKQLYNKATLMHTVDPAELTYTKHPRNKGTDEEEQQLSAAQHLNSFITCLQHAADDHQSGHCLLQAGKEADANEEVVQEAIDRLCAGHFFSTSGMRILLTVTQERLAAQFCLARLLLNSTVSHEVIGDILLESQFSQNIHPKLVDSVFATAKEHTNATLRISATVALGSISNRIRHQQPQTHTSILDHLQRQLIQTPRYIDSDYDSSHHVQVHLAALANSRECPAFYSILPWVNSKEISVRHTALRALVHFNCSNIEDLYARELAHDNSTKEAKAIIVQSLHHRHEKFGVKASTLQLLRQHALAEIGVESELQNALRYFYEENNKLSDEELSFWHNLQPTASKIQDTRKRMKRDLSIKDFLQPLLDERLGIAKTYQKVMGFKYAAGRTRLTLRNLLNIYASLFDGKMEIDIFNAAQVKVTFLGIIDEILIDGVAAFNAALSYKNPIQAHLLDARWRLIKTVVMAEKFTLDAVLENLNKFGNLLSTYRILTGAGFSTNPLTKFLPYARQFVQSLNRALPATTVADQMYLETIKVVQQLPDMQFVANSFRSLSNIDLSIPTQLKKKVMLIQSDTSSISASAADVSTAITDILAGIRDSDLPVPDTAMENAVQSANAAGAICRDIIVSSSSLGSLKDKFVPVNKLRDQAKSFSSAILWDRSLASSMNSQLQLLSSSLMGTQRAITEFSSKGLSPATPASERTAVKDGFVRAITSIKTTLDQVASSLIPLQNVSSEIRAFYNVLQTTGLTAISDIAAQSVHVKSELSQTSVSMATSASSAITSSIGMLQAAISTAEAQTDFVMRKSTEALNNIRHDLYKFLDNATSVFLATVRHAGKDVVFSQLLDTAGTLLKSQLQKLTKLVKSATVLTLKSSIQKTMAILQKSNYAATKLIVDSMSGGLSKLTQWVMDKNSQSLFSKVSQLSRDLREGAAHFIKYVANLEFIADSTRSFVERGENIVSEGPRIKMVAGYLIDFSKSIQVVTPLQALHSKDMNLTSATIAQALSRTKRIVSSVGTSLTVAPQLQHLLTDFRSQAEALVKNGLLIVEDNLNNYTLALHSTAKEAKFVLNLASEFVRYKQQTAQVSPLLQPIQPASVTAQDLQRTLAISVNSTVPAIVKYGSDFNALKISMQALIDDHLGNLDAYINFVCQPDAVCATDLVKHDLTVITAASTLLQSHVQGIATFLMSGKAAIQLKANTLLTNLQALQPLNAKTAAIIGNFSQLLATAKSGLPSIFSKSLSNLKSRLAQLKDISPSTLSAAVDSGGFVDNMVGFTGNIDKLCSFANDLSSLGLGKTQREWDSAASFSQAVKTFTESDASQKYKAAANQLVHASAAIRMFNKIFGPQVVSSTSSLIHAIQSVPVALLNATLNAFAGLQWQNRPVDKSTFPSWQQLPQCSANVCVRQIPVVKKDYDGVKFAHFRTLYRQKFVIPGLVEDWQPQGICMLKPGVILQTLFGTGVNKDKQPLIVAIDQNTGKLLKIYVIATPQDMLETAQFGIENAVEYIYLFGSYTKKTVRNSILHAINITQFTSTLTTSGPSNVIVDERYRPDAYGYGIFFERQRDVLWLADLYSTRAEPVKNVPYGHRSIPPGGLAVAIKLGVTGLPAVPPFVTSLHLYSTEVLIIGAGVQDLVVSKRHNVTYVALLKCMKIIGMSCKVEFRRIPDKPTFPYRHTTMKSIADNPKSLARSVQVPSGACGLGYTGIRWDRLLITFNSASQAQKKSDTMILGTIDDKTWVFTFPVMEQRLDPDKAVSRNELYLKVLDQFVVPTRELIPFDREKEYSASEPPRNREKRAEEDFQGCINIGGVLLPAKSKVLFQKTIFFTVLGIPMDFTMVARAVWGVDYNAGICLLDRSVKGAVIPYARINFDGSLAVNAVLVRFGIALVATVMDTKLYPIVTLGLTESSQLKICVTVDIKATALRLSLVAFAEFFLCFKITCKDGWISICYPTFAFCPPTRVTLYTLSFGKIAKRVFEKCRTPPDTTAPEPGQLEASQSSQTTLYSTWSGFSDPDSRDLKYSIAVGSFAGGSNIFKSEGQGNSETAVVPGLSFPHGKQVYVTVTAHNKEGLQTSVTAAPFIPDTTPPDVSVRDGNLSSTADIDFQWRTDQIQAVFSVTDETPVINSHWAIGRTPGASNVQGFTDAGYAALLVNANVNLLHNQRYYVTIQSVDQLGMITTKTSDGVLIDTTKPAGGTVADGSITVSRERDYIISTVNLQVSWTGFSDPESSLARYDWTIADNTGAELFQWRTVGLRVNAFSNGLDMKLGQKYRTLVRAWNKAGLYSIVESDGFTIDYTEPVCGQIQDVVDGESGDIDYTSVLSEIQASWSCHDAESGVVKYRAAVGSFKGGKDLHPYVDVSVRTDNTGTVSFPSLKIRPGQVYYVVISAKNRAGLEISEFSDGIMLDITPPHIAQGYLYDTLPLLFSRFDQDYQTTAEAAAPQWRFVFLDSESPVVSYTVGLLDINDRVLKQSTFPPSSTSATFSNLQLDNGRIYKAQINCTNEAGLSSSTKTDGFMVDVTAPRIGLVRDGQNVAEDIEYWDYATSAFGNYK